MILYLIRHAQSVANLLAERPLPAEGAGEGAPESGARVGGGSHSDESPPDFAGAPIDCPLTELGERQAAATAEHVAKNLGVDVVLSSPYLRTLQTADALRAAAAVPARVIPLLHEHHLIGFPDVWPLMRAEQIRTRFPHFEVAHDFVDVDWFCPPESEDGALARAGRILQWLLAEYDAASDTRIAVVTHGSPVSKMVQAFIDVPTSEHVRIGVDNASISTLETRENLRWVHAVNRIEHLMKVQK